jgi:predicted porin
MRQFERIIPVKFWWNERCVLITTDRSYVDNFNSGETMKIRPSLVVAALSSVASLAHAQGTVQLFGVLDISYLHTSADGNGSASSIATDANTSNRLGFRGTEDLGGGLKAAFWLEAGLSPDSGIGQATSVDNKTAGLAGINGSQGLTFGRKSTVSLIGSFGELRLGRDYVPSFMNLTASTHPFGTAGVGNSGQMFYPVNPAGSAVRNIVRASNSIGYFLPAGLGGFTGHFMYAIGEQASNAGATADDGQYVGASIGYRSAALNMVIATGTTKYATGDFTQSNFAVNYQFGPAKLMYLWGKNEVGVTSTTANMVGTQYKVGTGEVRFAYTTLKANKVANDATQWAVGYVHDLSKRTALYVNYSQVSNDGAGTRFAVGGGNSTTTPGGGSTGYDIGIRTSF